MDKDMAGIVVHNDEIADIVNEEFGVMPPAWRAAHRLIELGVNQQEVSDACGARGVPDPHSVATVNAIRNIKLGLKPPKARR